MNWELTHRRAVITGAANGIGRATALALAAEATRLLVVDLDAERLAETEEVCRTAGALHVETFAGDLTNIDNVRRVGEIVRDSWAGSTCSSRPRASSAGIRSSSCRTSTGTGS